jgi:hypothetical protein
VFLAAGRSSLAAARQKLPGRAELHHGQSRRQAQPGGRTGSAGSPTVQPSLKLRRKPKTPSRRNLNLLVLVLVHRDHRRDVGTVTWDESCVPDSSLHSVRASLRGASARQIGASRLKRNQPQSGVNYVGTMGQPPGRLTRLCFCVPSQLDSENCNFRSLKIDCFRNSVLTSRGFESTRMR